MKPTLLILVIILNSLRMIHADNLVWRGNIKDSLRNRVIEGAQIQLRDSDGAILTNAESNRYGNWRIEWQPSAISDNGPLSSASSGSLTNAPNPYLYETTLNFQLPYAGYVQIRVFDLLGRVLEQWSRECSAGNHALKWGGKGGCGILLLTVECGSYSRVLKLCQLQSGIAGFSQYQYQGPAHQTLSRANMAGSLPSSELSNTKGTLFHDALDNYSLVFTHSLYEAETLWVQEGDSLVPPLKLYSRHDRALVFDLHNDLLEATYNETYNWGERHGYHHTDLPRLIEGGVDGQVFVVWVDPEWYGSPYQIANTMIDEFNMQCEQNSAKLRGITHSSELTTLPAGMVGGIVGVEGGHIIENDLDKLRNLFQRGARYLTITWNNSTDWAVSAQDNRSTTVGLSDFGRQVIRTMDSLGMMIDVSHTGIKTIEDILAISANPVIASHSGAYAIRPHYRNLTDEQIIALAATGGLIGVVFYPTFLVNSGEATIDDVVDHIDYIVNLVGVDYVALGSDFDGISRVPVGLENVSQFPNLTQALYERGYSFADIEKILGLNFLRVFEQISHKKQQISISQ